MDWPSLNCFFHRAQTWGQLHRSVPGRTHHDGREQVVAVEEEVADDQSGKGKCEQGNGNLNTTIFLTAENCF